MSLAYLGPILIDFHGDPTFQWQPDPTLLGLRPATMGGSLTWDAGKQLQELVDNPDRRVTIHGVPGVLEVVWFDDNLLAELRGFYLLTQMTLPPTQPDSLNDIVPFSLTLTRLPDGASPTVTFSSRSPANPYGVTPTPLIADPFAGNSFVTSPSGTHITRAYDPEPHDSARTLVTAAAMDIYLAPTVAVVACVPGGDL